MEGEPAEKKLKYLLPGKDRDDYIYEKYYLKAGGIIYNMLVFKY